MVAELAELAELAPLSLIYVLGPQPNKLLATGSVHSREVDGISQANPQNSRTTARIVLYF